MMIREIFTVVWFYIKFLLHVLNFEECQASVSQHPGNIYGSLGLYKVSPSCAEFRRISSFCTTASRKYLRQSGFIQSFSSSCIEFRSIAKTRPCNILQFFTAVKNDTFQKKM